MATTAAMRRSAAPMAAALALAVVFASAASAQYAAGDRIAGRVVGIQDGDTLTVLTAENRQVRIRIANIDAPEDDQPFGERSKQMLAALAFGRDADIAVDDVDSYRRPIGRVRVGRDDVNAAMVRQGGAWVFARYNRDPSLVAAEAEARAARRGLWSLPESERLPPWEWRAAKRKERERRRAAAAGR